MKKINLKPEVKRFTLIAFICVAVILIILRAPQSIDVKEIKEFNRDVKNYNAKLLILNEKETQIAEFKIAIADNDEKKMYGLMNLNNLPKDQGMLFPFFRSAVIAMWMKNTRIPLDMIFINSDNVIANIKHNATPYSIEIISSEKEVNKVLEINGGLASKLGIKTGQKVKIIK